MRRLALRTAEGTEIMFPDQGLRRGMHACRIQWPQFPGQVGVVEPRPRLAVQQPIAVVAGNG